MFPIWIPNFMFRSSTTLELLSVYCFFSSPYLTGVKKGHNSKISFNQSNCRYMKTATWKLQNCKSFLTIQGRFQDKVVQKFKLCWIFFWYRTRVYLIYKRQNLTRLSAFIIPSPFSDFNLLTLAVYKLLTKSFFYKSPSKTNTLFRVARKPVTFCYHTLWSTS